MTPFKALCLLAIAVFPLGHSFANATSKHTPTKEEWRNMHQWKSRNAGGWRHGNWYGGIDPNDPERGSWGDAWYGISGWRWGTGVGPLSFYEDGDTGTQYYYNPYYYNAIPRGNTLDYDRYYPWGQGKAEEDLEIDLDE